jgi:hypothetical protein
MPALERRISLRGPRFWREDAALMFVNQIDASTRDGPRPATEDDKAAWPQAFAAAGFVGADPPGGPLISARDAGPRPAPPPRPFAARRESAK